MAITLAELDTEIARWRDRLALAGANLSELDELQPYRRLQGKLRANPPALTGVTLDKVSTALRAADGLCQHFILLGDAIQRADEARTSANRIFGVDPARLAEAEAILFGPSILVAEGETPFQERDLLSATQQQTRTTPAELLGRMQRIFKDAKDVVLKVDDAWKTLQQALTMADTQAGALEARAAAADAAPPDEIAAARAKIARQRADTERDPLGVAQILDSEVQPLLAAAAAKISVWEMLKTELAAAIAAARAGLADLAARNATCADLEASARLRIADTSRLAGPLDPSVFADLEGWLGTIERTAQSGNRKAALVGAARWQAALDTHRATLDRAMDANRVPLEQREELRGRLAALEAKSVAYRKRGRAISPEVLRLFEAARTVLYTRPTDLPRAARLVQEYEASLNACLTGP